MTKTARYASGEVPQVGDVVRCVYGEVSLLRTGALRKVREVTAFGCLVTGGYTWDSWRFALVDRKPTPEQQNATLAAENARLRQGLVLIARCIRDQANRYARTKLQADDDELQRLIGVFNLPDDRLIEAALQEAIYREGGE